MGAVVAGLGLKGLGLLAAEAGGSQSHAPLDLQRVREPREPEGNGVAVNYDSGRMPVNPLKQPLTL